ncbi:hypothetical protein KAR91_81185, partial [Candidatus Pacearchaeota archaeon]|nr:hypothetical protein [Candidatus Pacearchaeota archaeon]
MAERKLINKSDISEFFEIGKNLNASRVDTAIMLAQRNDLVPAIGEGLYFDLCENETILNDTLIQGEEYELQGTTVYFRGIRAQIACYAYARLIRKAENRITRSGLKQKETANSLQVDTTEENQMIRDAYSMAKKFETQTNKYLQENISDYPLAQQTEGMQLPRK